MKFGFDWSAKRLRDVDNNSHIHVCIPSAGADKPLKFLWFHEHKFTVNLV